MVMLRANLENMTLEVSLRQRTKHAPETAEFHFAPGKNEDVLWFHIYSIERTSIDARERENPTAMKHSMRIEIVESRHQLRSDFLQLKLARTWHTLILVVDRDQQGLFVSSRRCINEASMSTRWIENAQVLISLWISELLIISRKFWERMNESFEWRTIEDRTSRTEGVAIRSLLISFNRYRLFSFGMEKSYWKSSIILLVQLRWPLRTNDRIRLLARP